MLCYLKKMGQHLLSSSLSVFLVTGMLLPTPSYAKVSPELWFTPSDIQLPKQTHVGLLDNGLRYVILPTSKTSPDVAIRIRVGSGVSQDTESGLVASYTAMKTISGTQWYANALFSQTVFAKDLSQPTQMVLASELRNFSDKLMHFNAAPRTVDSDKLLYEETKMHFTHFNQTAQNNAYYGLEAEELNEVVSPSEKAIQALFSNEINQFHKANYFPANTTVVITGNVRIRESIKAIESAFGRWNNSAKAVTLIKPQAYLIDGNAQSDSDTNEFSISTLTSVNFVQDSKFYRRNLLLKQIANVALEQRLQLALSTIAPNASVNVESTVLFNDNVWSRVRVQYNNEDMVQLKQAVEHEIKRVISAGLSQSEFEQALSQIRETLKAQANSNAEGYAGKQADILVNDINSGLVYQTPSHLLELIDFHAAHLNEYDVVKSFEEMWAQNKAVFLMTSK
ncbi:insulinase family protein [Vibrio sp. TRT 17S01]|uniref:insulinase family protein n=1 Tax=Vibrio sp. TRT 17S01 TaxID=3418505 RepID=UPI003CF56D28